MNKIDIYLNSLVGWQKAYLDTFRKLIHDVEPSVAEDLKWNVPVFVFNEKVYFAMAAFKAHTKFNFILNGALINDSKDLFNNGFESKKSRGIDVHEGDVINKDDLRTLIKASLDS